MTSLNSSIAIVSLILVFFLPVAALGQDLLPSDTSHYDYDIPGQIDGDWEVADLVESGIDKILMTNLVAEIQQQRLANLHSVGKASPRKLVVR